MKRQLLFITIMGALCSCGSNNQSVQDKNVIISGDTISINSTSPIAQKLKILKVDTTLYSTSFSTSGIVCSVPSAYAEVASPFAGRIMKSYVSLGQQVHKGTPLFEISSPDFFEKSKLYFQAKQQMSLAEKTLQRERDLYDNKISAAKNVEEAEVSYQNALKEYENSVAALKAYNINPSTLVIGQLLTIVSPINGEVVKNTLVIGQYIKEDADSQVIVADLSLVWIIANVKERDLRLLNNISSVSIELVAFDEPVTGKVIHISELLDSESRSVEVIIACNNKERKLKPNMYGTVHISKAPTSVIIVPDSAILQQNENKYVLVKISNNRFCKVLVETAEADVNNSVVLSGIKRGDEIISEGAFYLIDNK
ncbi:MAG: efflux RND transporter periplasmic adaptor subunit [Bacteroidales bacterium]|jgi:cobalt-zinc-cadmium efflux system membrane fusion protein